MNEESNIVYVVSQELVSDLPSKTHEPLWLSDVKCVFRNANNLIVMKCAFNKNCGENDIRTCL